MLFYESGVVWIMDTRLMELLEILLKNNFITAKKLAECIDVSEKTVRNRIKSLQKEVKQNGALIEAKQHSGYKIQIIDKQKFSNWKQEEESNIEHSIPDSPEQRKKYLMHLFLNNKEYFKQEEISEQLCVSTKTLSAEMKRIEYILNQYNINIERRPLYGMKAIGHEFDFRKLMMDYSYKLEDEGTYGYKISDEIFEKIGSIIIETISENKISLSEISFRNLLLYLYVVYVRTSEGRFVHADNDHLNLVKDRKEYYIASVLVQRMNNIGLNINYTDDEVFYIAIYIAGKRMINSEYNIDPNFVIPDKIDKLVFYMLEAINEAYKIDFMDDFNTRMLINQHMMPFDIRMQYDIPLSNPLIDTIKQKYSFAYTLAQIAIVPISSYYNKEISDDEIGYFAILFQMALEKRNDEIDKKNILVVCVTGKASSQFLLFKFKKEFDRYINNIYICSLYEVKDYDYSNIDYVFSTVPIQHKVPVPIFYIKNFLENDEIIAVRDKLELGSMNFINSFYRKDLFFADIKAETKEEALLEMCKRIKQIEPISDVFYDSILAREELGNTDFGNLFAIPHPKDVLIKKNIVSVGILEKSIKWAQNDVQLIILVSVYDTAKQSVQKFYELTTRLLSNEEYIKEIISSKSYENLIRLLNR